MEELQKEIISLRAEQYRVKREAKDARDQCSQLESERNGLLARLQEQAAAIQNLQRGIDLLRHVQEQADSLAAANQSLQTELDGARTQVAALSRETEELRADKRRLEDTRLKMEVRGRGGGSCLRVSFS